MDTTSALRQPLVFATGPISLDFVVDEAIDLEHGFGRRAAWVVVGAPGPVQVWEVASPDPYRVLRLQASATLAGVRVALA